MSPPHRAEVAGCDAQRLGCTHHRTHSQPALDREPLKNRTVSYSSSNSQQKLWHRLEERNKKETNGFLTAHSALELFGSRYQGNVLCESIPVTWESQT